jgi:hypothetical protein
MASFQFRGTSANASKILNDYRAEVEEESCSNDDSDSDSSDASDLSTIESYNNEEAPVVRQKLFPNSNPNTTIRGMMMVSVQSQFLTDFCFLLSLSLS